jgi:hypothetical protein
MKSYTVNVYVIRGDDVEIELEVTGSVSAYVPAKRSGHPDTWSPSEGGDIEIETITLNGQKWDGELSPAERADAEDKLFEASQDDDSDYDYDDSYDHDDVIDYPEHY